MSRPPLAPKKSLTVDQAARMIALIDKSVVKLDAFDASRTGRTAPPEIVALMAEIHDALERAFGEGTSAFDRYRAAYSLWPSGFIHDDIESIMRRRETTKRLVEAAKSLLKQAQESLREDIRDAEVVPAQPLLPEAALPFSRKVFIVHGRDDGARETVARFVERIGFKPVILHEQANAGRTIAEKVEHYGDVGFAVVILSPDDEGGLIGTGNHQPRARQNVVLELGYFLGKLTRARVAALVRGNVEIPSDYAGVAYTPLDEAGGWRMKLAIELEEAGYDVDYNRVMKAGR